MPPGKIARMPANFGADPRDVLADLHSHSMISDGTLRPAELVARAHDQGVELFALTDHDEVAGLEEARGRGASPGPAVRSRG